MRGHATLSGDVAAMALAMIALLVLVTCVRGASAPIGIGLGVVALVATGWAVRALRAQPWQVTATAARASARSAMPVAVGFVVVVALLFRGPLRQSLFGPVTFSVDGAHHGAVVEWIRAHGHVPRSFQPELAGQSNYPAGTYVMASVVSLVARIPGYQAMWLLSVFWVVSMWFIAVAIVEDLIGERARAFCLVPAIVALAAWRYTLGMVTMDYFYAQLGGIWMGFAAVAVLVRWQRVGRSTWMQAVFAAVMTSAVLFSYPQAAPVPIAALVAGTLAGRVTRRQIGALFVGCAVAGAAGLVLARAIGFSRSTLAGGPGSRAPIGLTELGGPLVVALVIAGLIELVGRVARRSGPAATFLGAMAAPGVVAAGLAAFRLPVLGSVEVSSYRIAKNLYGLAPYGLVLATVAVVRSVSVLQSAAGWMPSASRSVVTAGIVSLVAVVYVAAPVQRSMMRRPVISRDEYAIASWARGHLDPNDVGIATRGLDGYHLWWVGLGRDVDDVVSSYGDTYRLVRWDGWPEATPEEYLITSASIAGRYLDRPGVEVVRQQGGAYLLRRTTGGEAT